MVPTEVQINEALTRKVAELARVELKDDEVQAFTRQLGQVLGYFEALKSVSVNDDQGRPIEPLLQTLEFDFADGLNGGSGGEGANPEFPGRPDHVEVNPEIDVMLSAPEVPALGEDRGFRVPQILG